MAGIVVIKKYLISEYEFERYMHYVSNSRQEKIRKYIKHEDRCRSLVAALLCRYMIRRKYKISNGELRFSILEKGKPVSNNDIKLDFNISHSDTCVACIIDDNDVGIDVEKIDKYNADISKRFFQTKESEFISSHDDKASVFYRIWTIKEAYIKYLRLGMYKRMNSFAVNLIDEYTSYIVDKEGREELKINSFYLEGGYYLSSVSQSDVVLEYIDWAKLSHYYE